MELIFAMVVGTVITAVIFGAKTVKAQAAAELRRGRRAAADAAQSWVDSGRRGSPMTSFAWWCWAGREIWRATRGRPANAIAGPVNGGLLRRLVDAFLAGMAEGARQNAAHTARLRDHRRQAQDGSADPGPKPSRPKAYLAVCDRCARVVASSSLVMHEGLMKCQICRAGTDPGTTAEATGPERAQPPAPPELSRPAPPADPAPVPAGHAMVHPGSSMSGKSPVAAPPSQPVTGTIPEAIEAAGEDNGEDPDDMKKIPPAPGTAPAIWNAPAPSRPASAPTRPLLQVTGLLSHTAGVDRPVRMILTALEELPLLLAHMDASLDTALVRRAATQRELCRAWAGRIGAGRTNLLRTLEAVDQAEQPVIAAVAAVGLDELPGDAAYLDQF